MRAGDKLDLARLKCSFRDLVTCGYALAAVGGVQYVLPGRTAVIPLMANHGRPARQVALLAEQRPANFVVRAVVLLSQIAGIIVVIAAAWLVWTQPSAMSWGFFLYVNWFNPGQAYAYYAILQQWPLVLLAQDIAGCFAQAIGYAGLLLFVLRAPNDVTEPRWRPLEKALPFVALAFALALTASYGSVLGYRTEVVTRAGIVAGFPVALCALGILLARRRTQKPEDYQRLRWVIWGCLIGLPAFLIAELASETGDLPYALGRLHAHGGHRRPALSRQRRALPVRVRGPAASARGERDDPAPPRDDPRSQPQRSRSLAAPRDGAHPGASGSARLGMDRPGCRGRIRVDPPARGRGSPCRRLLQPGDRRGGAEAWAGHPGS